jgi:hypothetical protein
MIDGTAGAMEPLMWLYAKGKPQDRVELEAQASSRSSPTPELRERMIVALESRL